MSDSPESQAPITVTASAPPSVRTWISLFVVALSVWVLIRYGTILMEVIAVVFGSYLLSLAMRPLAIRLQQRRIPPGVAVILVYAVVFGLLALLIWAAAPRFSVEMTRARQALPQLLDALQGRLATTPILNGIDLSPYTIAESTEEDLPAVAGAALKIVGDAAHVAVDLLLVLVLAYLFVADKRLGTGLLFTWVPKHRRWRVRTIFVNMSERLSRWLVAQAISATFFGVTYGIGLLLIGLPFAVTIALIGAVLEFVPYLGGFVSVLLATLTALVFEPAKLPLVLLLYFGVNQVQASFIQPFLFSRAVDVHPAVILIALLVGAQAGGVLGALFAVPTAVVLVTLLDEIEKPGQMPPEEFDDYEPEGPSLAEKLPGEVGERGLGDEDTEEAS